MRFGLVCSFATILILSAGLKAQSNSEIHEGATVTRIVSARVANSKATGLLVMLSTKRGGYIAKARSNQEVESIKQGDNVSVWREGGKIHIERASPLRALSLQLIRIDPCPPDMLHNGVCVITEK